MADVKKTAAGTAAKPETKSASTAKAEPAVPAKTAEAVTETEKNISDSGKAVKKPASTDKAAAKTTAKRVGRPAGKAATAVKAPVKKEAVKETMNIQFSGKSYSTEDLMKIAKDVWKYDLKQKVSELKSVELYVKPEEKVTYYVMNGEVTGSFYI